MNFDGEITMSEQQCEHCRFWERMETDMLYDGDKQLIMSDEVDDLVLTGFCKRFPPVIDVVELAREIATPKGPNNAFDGYTIQNYLLVKASKFPATWNSCSCGEFQQVELTARPIGEAEGGGA